MNGSDRQAYDRGTSLFSPDGRIYQVEYAREAVERGAPAVGVRGSDGVVLAARTRTPSSLMETESIEKLFRIDERIGAASSGHVGDARKLVDFARQRAQQDRLRYGETVGVSQLATEIGDHVQESTQRGGTRPYGAALLIAGVDDGQPRLFEIGPAGAPREWKAAAVGNDRTELEEFFETNYAPDLSLDEAATLALRSLAAVDEELTADTVAVAVVDEDGYRTRSTDEIETTLAEIDVDEESVADGSDDADEAGSEDR